MTDEELRYCTECGGKLSPNDQFCPSCGASIAAQEAGTASAAAAGAVPAATPMQQNRDGKSLRTMGILSLIYAVCAILFGLYFVTQAGAIVDMMMSVPDVWNELINMGYSEELLRNEMDLVGIIFLISGLLALGAAALMLKHTHGRIAVVLLALSSIAGFEMLLPLIVGLVITYLTYRRRSGFKSW